MNITGTENVLTADRSGIVDVNGLPGANGFTYRWETSTNGIDGWTNAPGTSNAQNYTVPAGNLNFFRVTVSYTDLDGLAESFVSQNTARVGNNVTDDTLDGTSLRQPAQRT